MKGDYLQPKLVPLHNILCTLRSLVLLLACTFSAKASSLWRPEKAAARIVGSSVPCISFCFFLTSCCLEYQCGDGLLLVRCPSKLSQCSPVFSFFALGGRKEDLHSTELSWETFGWSTTTFSLPVSLRLRLYKDCAETLLCLAVWSVLGISKWC